jgi:selenocysteine lyase/cysteine desulfurase
VGGALLGGRRTPVRPTAQFTPHTDVLVRHRWTPRRHRRAKRLAERAIFASSGDFYASTVIERLGYAREGLVRAGCACYTTEAEVDRLIEAVRAIGRAR